MKKIRNILQLAQLCLHGSIRRENERMNVHFIDQYYTKYDKVLYAPCIKIKDGVLGGSSKDKNQFQFFNDFGLNSSHDFTEFNSRVYAVSPYLPNIDVSFIKKNPADSANILGLFNWRNRGIGGINDHLRKQYKSHFDSKMFDFTYFMISSVAIFSLLFGVT